MNIKKTITLSVVSAIILAIIIGVIYNIKYGLSEEEKVQYNIVQKNADDEERDRSKAETAVEEYFNMLAEKQSSITNISWLTYPDVSGNYYYFSCKVEYSDLKREGTLTVKKESDGTFKATGLEFDD